MPRQSTRETHLAARLMQSRGSSVWRWRSRPLKALLLCFMNVALIANAPISSGLERMGSRVSDDQLSEMRGKFVSPDNVSYFGVSMMTSWQNSEGMTTSAVLVFSVDFLHGAGNQNGATPMVAVSWDRSGDSGADPGMDVLGFGQNAQNSYVAITPSFDVVPVGGLNSVSGAVQSQQIAGSDNHVLNSMRIAVLPASIAKQLEPSGLQKLSHGEGLAFSDGSKLDFEVGANTLGISMSNPGGTGIVQQAVDGQANQALQHVLLGDSLNGVSNSMVIAVGVNDLAQHQQIRADNALAAIRTIH